MNARRFASLVTVSIALAVPMVLAGPALAKGEHGTVVIHGPGLGAPVILRHDEAAAYIDGSGLFETKWIDPNIDGVLTPGADLGPAYDVSVSFGPECPGAQPARTTLYPFAEGGPQTLTGTGMSICGMTLPAGYWPAPDDMLDMLIAAGLPAPSPSTTASPTRGAGAGVVGGSGGTGPARWVGLTILLVLAGAGVVFALARRRRIAVS